MSLTAEQRELHDSHITGSKVAAILGISPYLSKYTLFAQMKGLAPDIEETQRMKIGKYAEDTMHNYCANEYQWDLRPGPSDGKFHPKYPQLWGLVDRLLYQPLPPSVNKNYLIPDPTHLVEFKNVDKFIYKQEWETQGGYPEVPDYYETQVRFYSALYELPAKFIVLVGGNEIVCFDMDRNEEAEEYIIHKCLEFDNDLKNDLWPKPDGSDSTTDTIKKLYPDSPGPVQMGNAVIYEWATKYKEADRIMKEREEEKAHFANLIKQEIGENEGMILPHQSKISWKKTKDGVKFNEEQFKAEHTDLWEMYAEKKPGHRVFRVTLH